MEKDEGKEKRREDKRKHVKVKGRGDKIRETRRGYWKRRTVEGKGKEETERQGEEQGIKF